MHAFRVPAACLAALIWVCTMARAEAHTFITVTVEMVADGDQLTVTVSVSPQDVIACLSPKAPATRGLIHALDGRLGPYLVQHVLMRIDGVAQAGRYGGYLPDLLQTSPAHRADEPLPDKLAFVMLWTLPANAAQINLGLTLFQEEQLPGVCHLALDPGGQGKRQIAYVELGKSWDFPLHPPRLPSSAVPLPPVGTSARRTSWWPLTLLPSPAGAMLTACSTTLALILALTLRDGWRQSRLLTLSAFAAALAAAAALVGSGVVAVGPRGSGLLAAGMILALSLGNLFPCPPSWWRVPPGWSTPARCDQQHPTDRICRTSSRNRKWWRSPKSPKKPRNRTNRTRRTSPIHPMRQTIHSVANLLATAILTASILICSSILILAAMPPVVWGVSLFGLLTLLWGVLMGFRLAIHVWRHGGL